jgi:acetolactate synthase I/III small subunit
MSHTLVTLMQNRPGVLHRAVSLFRRRGYNIESLAVGHSETPGVSRMTLVVDADDVEQVIKQLYRLVEVLKVTDVTHEQTLEREAALVKVNAPTANRADILATARACGATILDVGESTIMLEMTGPPEQVERFVEVIRPFGLKEMMRSGRIAMVRGAPERGTPRAAAVRRPAPAQGNGKEHGGGPAADVATPGPWVWQADGIA